MKIVFMGTPDFSVSILEALHHAGHEIVAVYAQPPRPAGRGKKLRASPVQAKAEALGLPVFTPTSLKSPEAQSDFASHGAEIAVVVAYGLLLPQVILDTPSHGCLNIHASLLPRWRGAAPIHRAILAGDSETGICIMQMEAGLDTGPVLLRESTPIAITETTDQLHDRLSSIGAQLIVTALEQLPQLSAIAQPEEGVSYASKIDKAEARIDWTKSATEIDRQIRGLSPFPGAWCEADGTRLKMLASELADGQGAPGVVLHGTTIACGTGAVKVTRLQRAGSRAMEADDFLNAAPLPGTLR